MGRAIDAAVGMTPRARAERALETIQEAWAELHPDLDLEDFKLSPHWRERWIGIVESEIVNSQAVP